MKNALYKAIDEEREKNKQLTKNLNNALDYIMGHFCACPAHETSFFTCHLNDMDDCLETDEQFKECWMKEISNWADNE